MWVRLYVYQLKRYGLQENWAMKLQEGGSTFTSPSVLPAQKPRGSKYPRGATAPGRNSALIESFVVDMRDMVVAGPKAKAETANTEAMIRDLNIAEDSLDRGMDYIVAKICSRIVCRRDTLDKLKTPEWNWRIGIWNQRAWRTDLRMRIFHFHTNSFLAFRTISCGPPSPCPPKTQDLELLTIIQGGHMNEWWRMDSVYILNNSN